MKNRHALNFLLAATLLSATVLTLHIPFVRAIEWSPENQLTTDQWMDVGPAIMQAHDGTVWVVWASNRIEWGHDNELFYKTSSDYGSNWSNDTRLTEEPIFNGSEDTSPSIMQASNGTIWVVWGSLRTGNYELFYKTSPDNGASWSNDIQLTYDSASDQAPSIAEARDGTIWVVWQSHETQADVYYKIYDGSTWSSNMPLIIDTQAHDRAPSIAQIHDRKIWVVWSTTRDANFDIYYKTSSEIILNARAHVANNVLYRSTTSRGGMGEGSPTSSVRVGNYYGWDGVTLYFSTDMRFKVDIPQGARIIDARLVFTARNADEYGSSPSGNGQTGVNTRIYGEDVDDAPGAEVANGRWLRSDMQPGGLYYWTYDVARTSAFLDWYDIEPWYTDNVYYSPDISNIIQEIVDRPGWSPGNNLVILWEEHDSSSVKGSYTFRLAYGYGQGDKTAKLEVTYEE